MNAGHFGLALAGVGLLALVGSAVGMSQVDTATLEKPLLAEEQTKYWKSDSVEIWTDPETGCKYVRATGSNSSYTVRVKPNGLPLCE